MELWQWVSTDKEQIKTWLAPADRDEHAPNFQRVGDPVYVSGLMFPMVFGMHKSELLDCAKKKETQRRIFQFQLCKDDESRDPILPIHTDQLKILSVLSEWSMSIAELIETLGWDLIELSSGYLELQEDLNWNIGEAMRAEIILKSGIEVMSYARGFKVFW